MRDSPSSRPVFGQAASAEALHIGEGGLPQFQKDLGFPKVRQSGGWDLGPMSQSTLRITFGSLAAHTVWRILGPRRPTWYPFRHHPSWSSTTKATLSRPGAEKADLDTNGLRTNIASPWITRTSCGSWECRRETKQPRESSE